MKNLRSLSLIRRSITQCFLTKRCLTFSFLWLAAIVTTNATSAQEINSEDRIGSNKGFDMCEDFRFKRISKLVNEEKLSQQQGFNIWKRIKSNEEAVKVLFDKAVAAKELTQDQAARLLPLLNMKMQYFDSQHGRFGRAKELQEGQFQAGEVSAENRAAFYTRLIAANERGDMYDFDVASMMKQLYAGFDPESASLEEVATYRGAMNPRIAQSGSQERVLQMARMERAGRGADRAGATRGDRAGYGSAELKIAEPADWIKELEQPIYSGPQPGEKALAFGAINLRGDQAGQEIDPISLAGDKLQLIIFVNEARTFGRFLGFLQRQLLAIEANSKYRWTMSVIVCTDDANEAEKSFAVLDQRYPKELLFCLSKDGSAGPPAYGLDKNITATVIVAKDGKVLHNLPYVSNAFYSQPHILGAIADAMDVDHIGLRKLLSNTPGDAAAAAKNGRKQRSRENQ
ncbi:MAG: hypothetical protein P8L85_18230 [Rubripirellula sp.]|nr:hypothetical protein [Rubripirellula sp.]